MHFQCSSQSQRQKIKIKIALLLVPKIFSLFQSNLKLKEATTEGFAT